MVSFANTEIAFKSKSKAELKKAYWLFKIVNNKLNVNLGKYLLKIVLFLHFPIKWILKPTIFKHFCGGETIDECNSTINNFSKNNIGTILDFSVEGENNNKSFDIIAKEIVETILRAANNKNIPFAVFKMTGIADFRLLSKINNKQDLSNTEQIDFQLLNKRLNFIFQAAYENEVSIFVDAEETWIQNAIDDLVFEKMLQFNDKKTIIFNTIQLYRTDRLVYLKKMFDSAEDKNIYLGFKIVRGAYMEKERKRALKMGYSSPIFSNKKETDDAYNEALRFCINHINRVSFCAGTHNEESSLLLTEMIEQTVKNNSDKRIYFAQLMGMSDHITYNLSAKTYNVAKYVPYGPIKSVMPYLIRRAEENTSVAGQSSRELSLIKSEIKRRKALGN